MVVVARFVTMGVTEWLINERETLFGGADPVVASLVLWHMVEETELWWNLVYEVG